MTSPPAVPPFRRAVRAVPFLAAVLALCSAALPAPAGERPHIVLVMADDQGWGDMGYTGHPLVQTPNFDAAAAAGLRFDRFYAAAPVCSPTRASVLTGRHPNRMGVFRWGHPIRPQEKTLAAALKSAGYATGHFGKWHLGSVRRDSPANPGRVGFDRWVSAPNYYDNDAILSDEGVAVQKEGESSFIAVEDALAWMGEVLEEGESPVFAVIWFGSPHAPFIAAEEDRALYEGQPEELANFLGEITGMDRAYGRLREALDEFGIRENTLVWYCSDNGALRDVGSTGGFRGLKGAIFEGGLLVPAFIEWPARIPEPFSTAMRANTSDMLPTLLEIAGVAPPQRPLDGISLLPLIDRENPPESQRPEGMGFWQHVEPGIRTPAAEWMAELLAAQQEGRDLTAHESSHRAAELPDPPHPEDRFPGHAAWIEGDWKLHRIESEADGAVRWELYDLAADPFEESDLAASEPARVAELGASLEEWLLDVVRSYNGRDY